MNDMRCFWVYMLASKPRGTLYLGVTNGLIRRVDEHRAGIGSAFTRKYKIHILVWCEAFADARAAIQREKTMKEWPRAWKVNLIEREICIGPTSILRCPVCAPFQATGPAERWVPGTSPGMTVEGEASTGALV